MREQTPIAVFLPQNASNTSQIKLKFPTVIISVVEIMRSVDGLKKNTESKNHTARASWKLEKGGSMVPKVSDELT